MIEAQLLPVYAIYRAVIKHCAHILNRYNPKRLKLTLITASAVSNHRRSETTSSPFGVNTRKVGILLHRLILNLNPFTKRCKSGVDDDDRRGDVARSGLNSRGITSA